MRVTEREAQERVAVALGRLAWQASTKRPSTGLGVRTEGSVSRDNHAARRLRRGRQLESGLEPPGGNQHGLRHANRCRELGIVTWRCRKGRDGKGSSRRSSLVHERDKARATRRAERRDGQARWLRQDSEVPQRVTRRASAKVGAVPTRQQQLERKQQRVGDVNARLAVGALHSEELAEAPTRADSA